MTTGTKPNRLGHSKACAIIVYLVKILSSMGLHDPLDNTGAKEYVCIQHCAHTNIEHGLHT